MVGHGASAHQQRAKPSNSRLSCQNARLITPSTVQTRTQSAVQKPSVDNLTAVR